MAAPVALSNEPIGLVADAMIARLRSVFGATVKAVEMMPGSFDEKIAKQLMNSAPAIYVALLEVREGTAAQSYNLVYGVYVVARLLANARLAPQGSALEIGSNRMIFETLRALDDYAVPSLAPETDNVTTLKFVDFDDTFNELFMQLGVTVYGGRFAANRVSFAAAFDKLANPEGLDAFARFEGAFVVPPVAAPSPPLPVTDPPPAGTAVAARVGVDLPQS